MGGHLATCLDDGDYSFIQKEGIDTGYWVGMINEKENKWHNLDGTEVATGTGKTRKLAYSFGGVCASYYNRELYYRLCKEEHRYVCKEGTVEASCGPCPKGLKREGGEKCVDPTKVLAKSPDAQKK